MPGGLPRLGGMLTAGIDSHTRPWPNGDVEMCKFLTCFQLEFHLANNFQELTPTCINYVYLHEL